MFRRRTDQVYATLQQVQRRITDANGGPALSGPTTDGKPAIDLNTSASGAPSPFVFGTGRPGVRPPPADTIFSLSRYHVGTLLLMWIATCVLAYLLGEHAGRRQIVVPPTPGPSDLAITSEAQMPAPAGDMILQLINEPADTPEARARLQKRADDLNGIMIKNAQRGWKPYFAVREPTAGGVQLIFGRTPDGQLGIDKTQFADFARIMQQPTPNGGGFASAVWIPAR